MTTSNTSKGIEIVEGKVLKLKNVLSKELLSRDPMEAQKEAYMFESYVKSKGFKPYGPSIVKTEAFFDNRALMERKTMMVQLRDIPDSLEMPYVFEGLVRVENCLLARYRGDMSSLSMAYAKLQLHAFENDITLKGSTYTVIVEQNEGGVVADVFAEMQT